MAGVGPLPLERAQHHVGEYAHFVGVKLGSTIKATTFFRSYTLDMVDSCKHRTSRTQDALDATLSSRFQSHTRLQATFKYSLFKPGHLKTTLTTPPHLTSIVRRVLYEAFKSRRTIYLIPHRHLLSLNQGQSSDETLGAGFTLRACDAPHYDRVLFRAVASYRPHALSARWTPQSPE